MDNSAFPFNTILFLIWGASVAVLWIKARRSMLVRFFLSPFASISAITLTLAVCIVTGITGYRWIMQSWPFTILILYFQTVLSFVILRGWRAPTASGARLGAVRWRFLFLHVGLLVTIASFFWGAPGNLELRARIVKDMPVREACDAEGMVTWLDYDLELMDMEVEYDMNSKPSQYSAFVRVNGNDVAVRVNHPYSVNIAESIYLVDYELEEDVSCVVGIVREPCRYVTLAGIVMMLLGALLLFVGGPRMLRK